MVGIIEVCSSRQLVPFFCVVFALLAAWSLLKQRLLPFWILFSYFVFFLVLGRLKSEAFSCLGMNSAGAHLQFRYHANHSGAALALAWVVSAMGGPCPGALPGPACPAVSCCEEDTNPRGALGSWSATGIAPCTPPFLEGIGCHPVPLSFPQSHLSQALSQERVLAGILDLSLFS